VVGVFFAQEEVNQRVQVFHGVVEVNDLEAAGEVDFAQGFQARCAVDEHNDFFGGGAAPAQGLFAQEQAQFFDVVHAARI